MTMTRIPETVVYVCDICGDEIIGQVPSVRIDVSHSEQRHACTTCKPKIMDLLTDIKDRRKKTLEMLRGVRSELESSGGRSS